MKIRLEKKEDSIVLYKDDISVDLVKHEGRLNMYSIISDLSGTHYKFKLDDTDNIYDTLYYKILDIIIFQRLKIGDPIYFYTDGDDLYTLHNKDEDDLKEIYWEDEI